MSLNTERLAKLEQLRSRLNKASEDNRKDLFDEHQKQKTHARDEARAARKRAKAEMLKERQDAVDEGEDPERRLAWNYSIEENDKWEQKLAEKAEKANTGFTDHTQMAHKKYSRQVSAIKPDLDAYNEIKASSLTKAGATLIVDQAGQLIRAQDDNGDFYRTANHVDYAGFDSRPSDQALDRLAKDVEKDIETKNKRSRKRDTDEDDLAHINERNRVFNRKLERFYGQHVSEIKQSLERGTML